MQERLHTEHREKEIRADDACGWCENPFRKKHKAHVFCCYRCCRLAQYARDRAERRADIELEGEGCICPWCSRTFDASRRIQKYCSESCQSASSRFRHVVVPNRARLSSLACSRCGQIIDGAKKSFKKYCHDCQKARRKETIREYYYRSRSRPVPDGPGFRYGEANGSAKLTDDAVRAIRAKSAQGARSSELGVLYGVDSSTVRVIVRRRTWKHV